MVIGNKLKELSGMINEILILNRIVEKKLLRIEEKDDEFFLQFSVKHKCRISARNYDEVTAPSNRSHSSIYQNYITVI